MTFTSSRPEISIDFRTAERILNRLGYTLDELNADSDYQPTNGAVSHQLYYPSDYNSANILGYIYCDNGIYFTDGENNYRHPEEAALELVAPHLVTDAYLLINSEICDLDYM